VREAFFSCRTGGWREDPADMGEPDDGGDPAEGGEPDEGKRALGLEGLTEC
jgi:hypothetical protein